MALVDPPGFSMRAEDDNHVARSSATASTAPDLSIVRKKLWEVAWQPMSGMFTTLLMLWMAGSALSLMGLLLTLMLLANPVRALAGIGTTFAPYDALLAGQRTLRNAKLVYTGLQVALLGVAVYKTAVLGILPFAPADWIRHVSIGGPPAVVGWTTQG